VTDQDVTDRTGEVIADRYELLSLIGGGAQAQVYRGVDLRVGDHVAVKILSDKIFQHPEWRERMFREAHAMTALAGTAAVRVFHQAWTADGALCLVMELLDGVDFETHLREIEARGEELSVDELITLLDPIVDTLEKAHAVGILHRDLKPANMYVLRGGGVRLLDFGLAKFVRLGGLTLGGFVAGTPTYIAPEGWLGDPTILDQRIDVYSLAVVIYRALAGEPPFSGKSAIEIRRLATSAERPSLFAKRPDLGEGIDEWVKAALAIDPAERFMRVSAMWTAFKSEAKKKVSAVPDGG
jgi:serine/threonine-protein kinase